MPARSVCGVVGGVICLGLLLALTGCASTEPQRPVEPEFDLRDPDPRRRTDAIQRVVDRGDRRWIPELIEMLDDRDEAVRLVAGAGLRSLTGRDTGYRAFASPEERRAQVAAWRTWYEGSTASGTSEPSFSPVPTPPPAPPLPTGRTP